MLGNAWPTWKSGAETCVSLQNAVWAKLHFPDFCHSIHYPELLLSSLSRSSLSIYVRKLSSLFPFQPGTANIFAAKPEACEGWKKSPGNSSAEKPAVCMQLCEPELIGTNIQ